MAEDDVDPQLQILTQRIATVRAAIEEEKAARAAIERRQALADDGPEQALAALRDEVTAARARLKALDGTTVRAPRASRESTARRTMYILGAVVAFPGAVPLVAMFITSPKDALDNVALLVCGGPLLIGLGLIARARFAKYRADRDELEGEFLP